MKLLRMAFSIIVGIPIIVIGIILIPLPGPGLLITFLGLFVLSIGFDSVKPYFENAKAALVKLWQAAKERGEAVEKKLNKDD